MSTGYYLDTNVEKKLMLGETRSTYRSGQFAWNVDPMSWAHIYAQHLTDNSISFVDEYGKKFSWGEMLGIITRQNVQEYESIGRLD